MTGLSPARENKGKLSALISYLQCLSPPVAIGVSGGIDSSLLLCVCIEVFGKEKVVPVFMDSEFIDDNSRDWINKLQDSLSINIVRKRWFPLTYLEIRSNTPLRCYWCKRTIYRHIKKATQAFGVKAILDGTQADDLKKDRPGLKALSELKIIIPLAATGITKDEIRKYALQYGLITASRKSEACRAVAINTGSLLTKYNLL